MFVPVTGSVTGKSITTSLKTQRQCSCRPLLDYNGAHNSVTRLSATNFSENEIGQLKIQVHRASGLFYSDREDENAEYSPDKESIIEHPKMTANIPHRVG